MGLGPAEQNEEEDLSLNWPATLLAQGMPNRRKRKLYDGPMEDTERDTKRRNVAATSLMSQASGHDGFTVTHTQSQGDYNSSIPGQPLSNSQTDYRQMKPRTPKEMALVNKALIYTVADHFRHTGIFFLPSLDEDTYATSVHKMQQSLDSHWQLPKPFYHEDRAPRLIQSNIPWNGSFQCWQPPHGDSDHIARVVVDFQFKFECQLGRDPMRSSQMELPLPATER